MTEAELKAIETRAAATEHPTIRCPTCGGGAIDIAPDYDPFAPRADPTLGLRVDSVSATCAAGHRWIEGHRPDAAGSVNRVGLRGQMPF